MAIYTFTTLYQKLHYSFSENQKSEAKLENIPSECWPTHYAGSSRSVHFFSFSFDSWYRFTHSNIRLANVTTVDWVILDEELTPRQIYNTQKE
jgi:hypothetical protein